MEIGAADMGRWLAALHDVYAANKTWLTELDSAIGDADHGINLDRGFSAAAAALETQPQADVSGVLKTVARALISTVGGASGPLYGTFFLRGSAACSGKATLDAKDVVAMFAAGIQGIQQLGKAQAGDKTMLDALLPALAAMQEALAEGSDLPAIMERAAATAETGMLGTIPLEARKGRASYLGPRSVGHQDPGATSAHLLIKTAAETWR